MGPSIKPRSVQVDHTTIICVVLYTILYSSVRYMWDHQSSLRLYKLTIQQLFVWFYILFCTVLFVICGTINQASVCTSLPYNDNLCGTSYYFVQFCLLYVGPSIKPRFVQVDNTTIICYFTYYFVHALYSIFVQVCLLYVGQSIKHVRGAHTEEVNAQLWQLWPMQGPRCRNPRSGQQTPSMI